ncbi:MAG: 50S ribosomal protein L25 [Planctomycetota bacterium]
MHEDAPTLTAKIRERIGSRYAKRVRDAGGLPAVVYGHGETPESVSLNAKEALEHFHKGEKVFTLAIESDGGKNNEQTVLLKDLQFDHLGTNVVHADFARVDLTERVNTRAHLELVGDAPGLKHTGAILMQPITELDLECQVTNLPDSIEVSVAELDVDHPIHAKDVKLPKPTMVLLTDPEAIVAQIVIQTHEEEDATAEGGEVSAAGSPEVLTEKKKEEEG